MDKTKFLVFIALGAILLACSSENGSPPQLVNSYPNLISPFDTIVVKFNTGLVDLDTSGESDVVLGNGKIWIKKKTISKELYFVGANTTPGGLNYFSGGRQDSIVFKKIKNSDGYVNDRAAFYFSTHAILDKEPNNRQEDANDIADITGVPFAGVIDKEGMEINDQGFYNSDNYDFYKLNLKRDDIVSITISNKIAPLKVRFFGACYSTNKSTCNDKTDSTTAKKNSITLIDTVKTGHLQGDDPINKLSLFYISIFENTSDKPNPYTVTVVKK